MKIKSIIYPLIFLLFSTKCFSSELWNGFCSGMNSQEVKNLIKEKISIKNLSEDFIRNPKNYPKEDEIGIYYTSKLNIKTTEKEFYQDEYGFDYQLTFYFIDNELYHVKILYNLTGNEILQCLKNKYKNPSNVEKEPFYLGWNDLYPAGYNYKYSWKNERNYIEFLNTANDYKNSQNIVSFVDLSYKENQNQKLKQEQELLKEKEALNKQQILNNSVF